MRTDEAKKHILRVVGIHQSPALVVPILASVLESQETDPTGVRHQASSLSGRL